MKWFLPLTQGQKALIRKDFYQVWKTPMLRNTLLALPAVLMVVMPVGFLVIACLAPMKDMNGMEELMALLPQKAKELNERQMMFYVMTTMMAPMLFLMIPLMSSTVTASGSFVGEKEKGTMESLLLTPMTVKEIFRAKVEMCVRLSLLVTGISLVLFGVTAAVGNMILKMPFWLDWSWLVVIVLLAPALTVFGVVFMVLVSGRSKSYMEAMQTSGYIVLPLILLFVGQFTGLFVLGLLALAVLALVIFLLDYGLFRIASGKFTPEKLLKK